MDHRRFRGQNKQFGTDFQPNLLRRRVVDFKANALVLYNEIDNDTRLGQIHVFRHSQNGSVVERLENVFDILSLRLADKKNLAIPQIIQGN